MAAHSFVWLGVGIVAFAYWLRAVDFFPSRREPEYDAPQNDMAYNKNW